MPPKTGKPSHSASKSPKRKSKGTLDDETSEVNILSSDATLNAYYICHTVADCLDARGYPWEGAAKGKKKKKK